MSDKIKKSPQIRFVGFNDTWEQRKAEEIFKTVSDKGHTELPVLSASQQLGMVRRDENGIDIQYDKKSVVNYKRVLPKQFVIHLRSFQGGFAHSSLEGITSPAYTIIDFKPENNQSDLFWKEIFTSKKFIKNLETVTYGIRDGRSISFNDFKTLLFTLPSYKEQEQIAGFFNDLNNFITLHQRKLELLKDMKKSLLQKMFPKDGANIPEIRFAGFTYAWEQRKLGDVIDGLYNGQTPLRFRDDFWNGSINWLSSGELNRSIVKKASEKITEAGQADANLRIVPKNTFVMAITGLEAAGTRGNCGILGIDTTLNQSCMAVYPNKKMLNTKFLFQWYKKVGEKYGIRFTQGTKQQSYNAEIIKDLDICLPKIEEQLKIAQLLSELDNLITLNQRELNSLKNLKSSLLKQLFV
ncbi:restriction endonuclease subunit S [Bacillus altitudinis]|uniref:restriction endonuclease subunit S n=1 Tax=Bacillus altitudinis TaxID=293387 RepID=UPI001B83D511|nr:restriction endonuclease subunit S [Bacillus altitudinis]MBR0579435.1 restriction endonuclease subunit S [Bacillus altitudinis A23-8]